MAQKYMDLVNKEYLAQQIAGKADSSSLGTAASKNFTTNVSVGSADLPTSGGVYSVTHAIEEDVADLKQETTNAGLSQFSINDDGELCIEYEIE